MRVRPAMEADAGAIRAVLVEAFPTGGEADLVEQLRADGDMVIEFVAVDEDRVVGHIGFSTIKVTADGERVTALGLAPMGVVESHERRGIGGRLIESGLAAANGRGYRIVFVLGAEPYYGNHGFSAAAARPFASPYAGPHLLAQWLSSPKAPASGEAAYAPAFADLA